MLGIPQGGSPNDAEAVAVKENQAWIRGMVIGENRSRLVKLVHEVSRNLALLDQVGASDRPFRFITRGVDSGQFLEGFSLRMRGLLPARRKRK